MFEMLSIELTSFCNRDCDWCPRSGDTSGIRKNPDGSRVKKLMPLTTAKGLILEATTLGFKGTVSFHRLSEPLIDPRYIEIAQYAKSKGLIIKEYTNGDVLRKNVTIPEEIDGLIDELVVGMYDETEPDSWWLDTFKKTKIIFSRPQAKWRYREGSRLTTDRDPPSHQSCKRTNNLLIRYDGEVSLCCEDDQCSFGLGNINKSTIKDIWFSEKRLSIVKVLSEAGGRKNFEKCAKCHMGAKRE